MSDLDDLLDDITGAPPAELPRRLRDAGLHLVGHPEEAGGVGGTGYDAATVISRVAQAGADLALTERLLVAAHVSAAAGLRVDPATVAVAVPGEDVAGLRDATQVLLVTPAGVAVLDTWSSIPGENLGGDARDTLRAGDVTPAGPDLTDAVRLLGALGRACEIAGALRAVLDLTVRYTGERQQFGRPLRSQQLVQVHLAEIATQLAATEAAVAAVFDAGDDLTDPLPAVAIAAAKFQASTAAVTVARHAHQATGAIGMAAEYPLGRFSRRLWAWAEEHGSRRYWAGRLGAAAAGHPDLWSLVGETVRLDGAIRMPPR